MRGLFLILSLLIFLLAADKSFSMTCFAASPLYHMVTAPLVNGEVVFDSDQDFEEAMHVGFFRIKAPFDLNIEAGRYFAKTFTSNPRYNQFGMLNVVNGYLQSEIVQTVRFSLERDNWNKCHIHGVEIEGPPNFPLEIQELGDRLNEIGVAVLKTILKKHDLPEHLWFDATAGASHGEGSCFIKFNCYDPKLSKRAYGVGAHKDWGHISILDVTDPGLEAYIDGVWKELYIEDGYLIINFGYVLEKLLPGVKASEHRVATQKEKMRTSTVVFIDPRVGPYHNQEGVGYVYDWDAEQKKLIHGEPTTSFFEKLSVMLYGENQTGSGS